MHQAHAAGWTTRAVVRGDGVDGDDRGIDGDRRGREICHGRGDEFGSGLIAERFHGGAEQAVVADLGESLGQDVLVAAESLTALRRAYPNYYLDTERFLEGLRKATAR